MAVLSPTSVDQLLDMLGANPAADLIAGGTDFMVEVNLHSRRPQSVISLRHVAELREWNHRPNRSLVTIGAGLPYASMEHGEIARLLPALAQAARTVGSPQIRAAGTIGGNLGTCSPAGDILPVLAALDATIHVISADGARDLTWSDFMLGVKRNALQPGEIVHSVSLPVVDGWQGYAKVGTRNAMVISTVSACLVRDADEGMVALALGAVGPTVIRCFDAERWLAGSTGLRRGGTISDEIALEFGQRASAESRPIDDHRSTAEYRRHAVGVLATRLLKRSFA
jgi:CO/xanthine dehydrogenase FAD-binding subunit